MSEQTRKDDAARVELIREAAKDLRVIPRDLVDFLIIHGYTLEQSEEAFSAYQKTGSVTIGHSTFGESH